MLVEGYIELRPDGTFWRVRNHGNNRPIDPPRRCDLGKRHKQIKWYNSEGEIHAIQAHRLVWQYYNGDIPERYNINHKDGDPTNNRLENLELMTQSEQQLHRFRVLGHKDAHTLVRERHEAVLIAAREAVATGQLDGLREALETFDAEDMKWPKGRQRRNHQ